MFYQIFTFYEYKVIESIAKSSLPFCFYYEAQRLNTRTIAYISELPSPLLEQISLAHAHLKYNNFLNTRILPQFFLLPNHFIIQHFL